MTTTNEYKTDIVLGELYRDEQTGLEGIATAVTFHQHACERVMIEFVNDHDGKLMEYVFDSPRLVHVETGVKATTEKTGGPDHSATRGDSAMTR